MKRWADFSPALFTGLLWLFEDWCRPDEPVPGICSSVRSPLVKDPSLDPPEGSPCGPPIECLLFLQMKTCKVTRWKKRKRRNKERDNRNYKKNHNKTSRCRGFFVYPLPTVVSDPRLAQVQIWSLAYLNTLKVSMSTTFPFWTPSYFPRAKYNFALTLRTFIHVDFLLQDWGMWQLCFVSHKETQIRAFAGHMPQRKRMQQFIPDTVFVCHCQRIYLCECLSKLKNMRRLVACAPAQYEAADCFSMTAAVWALGWTACNAPPHRSEGNTIWPCALPTPKLWNKCSLLHYLLSHYNSSQREQRLKPHSAGNNMLALCVMPLSTKLALDSLIWFFSFLSSIYFSYSYVVSSFFI